jgi:TolA protein
MNQGEWEPGLWWMVLASAGLHVLFVAAMLVSPLSLTRVRQAPVSYTVDLIAPNKLGGTNLIPGRKHKAGAAPAVEARKPEKVAKIEAPAPPAVKKPLPKPKAKPKAKPAIKVEKKVPPAAKKKPAPEKIAPKPEPKAKVAVSKKPAAKPQPEKKPAQTKPEPAKKAATEAEAAPQGKAEVAPAKESREAAAPSDLDARIAAAVKRIERQAGVPSAGGGEKAEAAGGPLSVGPGEGAGGIVRGVEWLVYKNRVERQIKDAWRWAGNHDLEAEIHFGVTDTGEVINVRLARSSGDPTFDTSAERAVRAASPLPPPPEAYRDEFRDFQLVFSGAESLEM